MIRTPPTPPPPPTPEFSILDQLNVLTEYNIFSYLVAADEDEEYFTLAKIKDKLEDENGWKSNFKGGLDKIEVECVEKYLESRAAKEEIRYDFIFYTPSCRYARVKVHIF